MGGDFPRGSSPGQRESSKAQLLALRCGAGSVRRADMAEVGEAANDPLYALGLTHARVVQTALLVGIAFWSLASLVFCCCCVRKCVEAEILDDDAQDDMSDYPQPPKFTSEEKRRLGRRRRMRLHQYMCYLLRVGWYLLGDACQAVIYFVFAMIFAFFAFVNIMPASFGGSAITLQVLGYVIAVTLLGAALRIMQVVLAMYIVEPMQAAAGSGYDRLDRLEKRMDAGLRSVEEVKDRLEDGLHHMKEGVEKFAQPALEKVERLYEALHLHSQVTEDFGRRVHETAVGAENSAILAAAHATRRQDIHMFGTNAYHL